MKKRYVLYGHTISLLNKIIWLILDALMRKNAVKLPTTQKNIPNTQIGLTFCENSARIFTKDCAMMPAL